MSRVPIESGSGFVEIADRCYVARRPWVDVNVGIVAGSDGLLVVDTHASEAAGRRLVGEIEELGLGDVVAVVSTHDHYDHWFGNAAFAQRWPAVRMLAHEDAADGMVERGEAFRAQYGADEQQADEVAATTLVGPTETLSSVALVDLGDRVVEVLHPGRGHTAGDLVINVPDAQVLYLGDLVEESGPAAYGDDCYPLEWPGTLDLLLGMLTDASIGVPGHGQPVDKAFVQDQRVDIGVVAENIRDVVTRGVDPASVSWPYPLERLDAAIARGREHLPARTRSLPLL